MRFFQGVLLLVSAISVIGAQTPAPTNRLSQADTSACPSAAVPTSGGAQPTPPRDSARPPGGGRESSAASENATIILRASASAREVRFAAQPRIVVRLCGAVTDSVRVVERRNLPDRVQPGTTYRDVYIAVEILGHLNAQCLASRMGVAAQPATSNDPCASVTVRDSAQARPAAPRRPPQ
jgi:hypothetical protein